jgi:hypothetical protein
MRLSGADLLEYSIAARRWLGGSLDAGVGVSFGLWSFSAPDITARRASQQR